MTVSTEVDHNDYAGNGVTTSFPYTFRIFQKTDLMVQVVDLSENITALTLDTDYSVTGAGTYSGGSVVLSSPLANGWQISISRSLPVTQETDLRNQGKFFAEVHEDAFDKLTMLIQQCFSFLRLALRKPSFIANYYDALNNRIRNLRDPSQAQDAATKSYVDSSVSGSISHAEDLFKRTLRVPEDSIPILPNAYSRKGKVHTYDAATGEPLLIPAGQLSIGDILNLSSSDGLKYIGRCSTFSELRVIEPQSDKQLIDVICHTTIDTSNPYQIDSGGKFQADFSDTTSTDDNWLCVVTPGGKRWKRVINDTLLNLAWSGVKPGDDITTPLKNAIAYIKKIFIAGSGPAFTPVIAINAGNYIISSTIAKPPFIKLVCMGSVDIDASSISTGVLFDVFNDSTIPKPSFSGPGMNCDDISCVGGTLTVTGSGRTEGGVIAFSYGNKSAGLAPCRGVGFRNVVAKFFGAGLSIRPNDTYLLTFSDSRLEQNYTNFITSSVTSINSGEAIVLSNMIFGGSGNDHIYVNSPGMELIFDKCKADYAYGHVINVGTQCNFSSLKFTNFRCEEFRGYFLTGTPSALGNVNIFFDNLTILGRPYGETTLANSPSRKLFNIGSGINATVRGFEAFVEKRPYSSDINISTEAGGSLRISEYLIREYRYLTGKSYILNRGSDFSDETVGTAITSASNQLVRFNINTVTDVSGLVISLDGGKALQLTGSTASSRLILFSEYTPVQPGNIVAASGSVQALSSTAAINYGMQVSWYDKDLVFMSSSTVSTYDFIAAYNDTTLPNYSEGRTRKLSSSAFAKTAPPGAFFARARWEISGFVGAINVINLVAFKSL
ncbi:TPA: hypothetical protein ACTW9J_000122 [Klebsiella michiganensis]